MVPNGILHQHAPPFRGLRVKFLVQSGAHAIANCERVKEKSAAEHFFSRIGARGVTGQQGRQRQPSVTSQLSVRPLTLREAREQESILLR